MSLIIKGNAIKRDQELLETTFKKFKINIDLKKLNKTNKLKARNIYWLRLK